MLLDISKALKSPGQSFGFSVTASFGPMDAAGEMLRFTDPVHVTGSFVYTGEDFFLRGSIRAEYVALCSRCLKEILSVMEISFSEEFARTEDDEHPDRYLFEGEQLKLEQMVQDLISLNAPMRHLCEEGCRGLCPVCGADRNAAECGCPHPSDDGSTSNS